MKAAVLRKLKDRLVFEEFPDPKIGRSEVLVQTKAVGICGTDLHIIDGWGYVPDLPHILGHEPAGIVAAIGEDVQGFKVGDRVVPNIFYSCGRCSYCRAGRETLCADLAGILGVLRHHGAYAEYFKVPGRQLFHLPDCISFEEAGVIADAVVCAVHAVLDRAEVKISELVLVIGIGGVGSSVLQMAKACGARVVAVDLHERKLACARELGADEVLLADDRNIRQQIARLTNGLGADVVFDCVGTQPTLALSISCLRRGGRLVTVGYTQDRYPIDPREITVNELEIRGSRSGGCKNTLQAIELVASRQVRPLLGSVMPLSEANDALEKLRKSDVVGRIVLTLS
jgi:D-arabinose 1-dehydrogenase-like Zn-dependent alcohol dehydrogenase